MTLKQIGTYDVFLDPDEIAGVQRVLVNHYYQTTLILKGGHVIYFDCSCKTLLDLVEDAKKPVRRCQLRNPSGIRKV